MGHAADRPVSVCAGGGAMVLGRWPYGPLIRHHLLSSDCSLPSWRRAPSTIASTSAAIMHYCTQSVDRRTTLHRAQAGLPSVALTAFC